MDNRIDLYRKYLDAAAEGKDNQLHFNLLKNALIAFSGLVKSKKALERRFESIFGSLTEGVISTDQKGIVVQCNQSVKDIFKLEEEVTGKAATSIYGNTVREDGSAFYFNDCPVNHVLRQGEGVAGQVLGKTNPDDSITWVMINAEPMKDSSGAIAGVVATFSDISKRKANEDKLTQFNRKLYAIFESMEDFICVIDKNGYFLEYYLPNELRVFEIGHYDLIGTHFSKSKLPKEMKKNIRNILKEIKNDGLSRQFDYSIKNGTMTYWFSAKVSSYVDMMGNFAGVTLVSRDITDRKKIERKLQDMSSTDPLTGVFNRRTFINHFNIEMGRMNRIDKRVCLLMLDIDHFKKINDSYGHNTGDEVLKAITDIVSSQARKSDLFARWGGEEFIMLFSPGNIEACRLTAERFRKSIEKHAFPGVGKVTASFGVADVDSGDDVETAVKRVDDALYTAKKQGRNRVAASV